MRWVYHVSKFVIWCCCKVWLRGTVEGQDNVPPDGSLIIVCNHSSHLDPLVLGVFLPRRCWFVARSDLSRIPLAGLWMRAIGVIFIRREAPGREAMGRVIDTVGSNGEGRRLEQRASSHPS